MKKFKNVFLAFFVTALTSLNLALPAYAEEATTQTVDSAGFSVSVVGDGTVTLSSGDFTKSLSNGDIYNADYEEGTEIKIVSKSNENAVIDDITMNNSTISGFTSGKKSFSFVYTTKTADANFSVTFKTKELVNVTITGDNISVTDAGGSGGASGGGPANDTAAVAWAIHDWNDDGFGLAMNTDGSYNYKAVLKVIGTTMNLDCNENYTVNGKNTKTTIVNALKDAVKECKENYQKYYGTADGFKPRIVAVGVSHGKIAINGKPGQYNPSFYNNDECYWNPVWKTATKNLTLKHGNKEYTVDSAFHNGGSSLTHMATVDLANHSNLRIIVLDDTQPEPPVKKGKLSIKKTSANPAITDNNPCYSLQGAEYGVYKTEADAKADKNKVNTLTIGKYDNSEKYKDWSNEIELDAGTYYVKETKNPKGYALSSAINKITVTSGKTTQYGTNGELKDYPQSDPVGILLGKIDKETNKNKPQGSASLEGAEFTVKYYKGLYDSDPAKSGQIPSRSWVLKTNDKGYCKLKDEFKVSGDKFYYNGNSDPTLPVGTITIQETKAPTGYFINNELFVRKITSEGMDDDVHTYNQPEVLEKVIKFDIKKVQAGTSTPVAGAVFLHTLPDGSTKELTTNDSGEITITGLASGTHKIKEIKSPDGYQLNPNEVVFNVASGTGKITFTSGTNSLVTHGTKDSGDGYATFGEKVNPFNLKITKTNEHGNVLKGAEFTLYSDEKCEKVVDTQTSDDKGLLSFKNLDVEKTYYFKETKAPQGYRIPVDKNGKAYVHSVYVKATPQTNTFEFTVDGIKYDTSKTTGNVRLEGTKKDRVVAVDITNKTTQLLPETGSNGTILLIGLGVAVIAFALYKSKKDKMISK